MDELLTIAVSTAAFCPDSNDRLGGVIASAADSPAPDNSPSTEPSIHNTDLLGPKFASHVHGIEFRPPAE